MFLWGLPFPKISPGWCLLTRFKDVASEESLLSHTQNALFLRPTQPSCCIFRKFLHFYSQNIFLVLQFCTTRTATIVVQFNIVPCLNYFSSLLIGLSVFTLMILSPHSNHSDLVRLDHVAPQNHQLFPISQRLNTNDLPRAHNPPNDLDEIWSILECIL